MRASRAANKLGSTEIGSWVRSKVLSVTLADSTCTDSATTGSPESKLSAANEGDGNSEVRVSQPKRKSISSGKDIRLLALARFCSALANFFDKSSDAFPTTPIDFWVIFNVSLRPSMTKPIFLLFSEANTRLIFARPTPISAFSTVRPNTLNTAFNGPQLSNVFANFLATLRLSSIFWIFCSSLSIDLNFRFSNDSGALVTEITLAPV